METSNRPIARSIVLTGTLLLARCEYGHWYSIRPAPGFTVQDERVGVHARDEKLAYRIGTSGLNSFCCYVDVDLINVGDEELFVRPGEAEVSSRCGPIAVTGRSRWGHGENVTTFEEMDAKVHQVNDYARRDAPAEITLAPHSYLRLELSVVFRGGRCSPHKLRFPVSSGLTVAATFGDEHSF